MKIQMYRFLTNTLIGIFVILTLANLLFAATPDTGMESNITVLVIFAVTIMLAIAFGLILYNMARRDHELKGAGFKKKSANKGSLISVISEQIQNLSGSAKSGEELTGVIMNIVNEELETRTNLVKEEISRKYEDLIDVKKQAIASLQGKYNNIISEKKQTESVLRSVAEGLVVVNDKGDVILMNPAAEKLLDVKKEKKVGKPLLEDIKDEQLISLVSGSAVGEKEIVLASKKVDTKKVLRSSSAVIEDENGKTVGMVSVLSDITKQRELEQLKSDFVANVSHELRTPIVAIQKSIAVILEKAAGPLTEPQEKFLTAAKSNLQRLDRLINDLLDLSKLEAKKMTLKLESISIEKIINDACESLDNWAKAKAIIIEKTIQNDLAAIRIDPLRIIQVLNNLIGNAIKFTPNDGKIMIETKLREENNEIEISVADNGIGIAKEDLSKVFDKFEQAGERTWTDISGTGLGLSIAKEIVELHAGKIWVESEKGKGAKFTFTLPYKNQ